MVSDEADQFLRDAAGLSGRTPDQVLDLVLGIGAIDGVDIAGFWEDSDEEVRSMFEELDHAIRVRNPRVQYVVRSHYLGYRREGLSSHYKSERSQIFLSIRRTKRRFVVCIPVDPQPHSDFAGVRDLGTLGRHGIGDLEVRISSREHLAGFIDRFDTWISGTSDH